MKLSTHAKHTIIITALAAIGVVGVVIAFPGRANADPFLSRITPASPASPVTKPGGLPLVGTPSAPASPATPVGLPLVGTPSTPSTQSATATTATRNWTARSLADAIALPSAPALTHGAWMGGGLGEFGGHVGLGFVAATALPHHLTGSFAIAGTPSHLGEPAIRMEIGGSFGNWG